MAGLASEKLVSPLWDAFSGQKEIAQAGQAAYTATQEENLKTQQQLQAKAAKEAADQKKASAAAAQSTGEKNLQARAAAYQKAEQGQQSEQDAAAKAQESFQNKAAKAQEDANKQFETSAQKLRERSADDAYQETLQTTLGRTPQQTQQGQTADAPEFAERQSRLKGIFSQASSARGRELGQRFDSVFDPVAKKEIETPTLATTAQQMRQKALEQGWVISPKVEKALQEAEGYGAPSTARPADISAKDWARLGEGDRQAILRSNQTQAQLKPAVVVNRPDFKYPEGRGPSAEAQAAKVESTAATVGKVRGFQSRLGGAIDSTAGTTDSVIVSALRKAANEDLLNANVPGAKQLKAEWMAHVNGGIGDYSIQGRIHDAADVAQEGKLIFDNPQVAQQLVKNTTPEQKADLRELYADYINSGKGKPQAIHADTLKQLGFTGPFAKPEGWVYAQKQVDNLGELFETSPAAKAKLQAAIQDAKVAAKEKYAKDILRAAQEDGARLGNAGARIKATIDAAKTTDEKVQVALDAFNKLDPKTVPQGASGPQATQQVGAAQQTPGSAAYQAASTAPRQARNALHNFEPKDPNQAAIEAIQGSKGGPGNFASRWKRRAEFWAPLAIGGGVIGRPSTFAEAGLMMGVPIAAREGIAAWYRSSMRDPATAAVFWRAISNPGTKDGLNAIAKGIVNATISRGAASATESKPGRPEPKGPGPMSKAAEQRRAEVIADAQPGAGGNASLVRLLKLVGGRVHKGETPNVTVALARGQMSPAHVRKLVSPTPESIGAVFANLSPSDAIVVFAKGSPDEQAMTLPSLVQKIHAEGSKMPRQQQMALMNQLRSVIEKEEPLGGQDRYNMNV